METFHNAKGDKSCMTQFCGNIVSLLSCVALALIIDIHKYFLTIFIIEIGNILDYIHRILDYLDCNTLQLTCKALDQ